MPASRRPRPGSTHCDGSWLPPPALLVADLDAVPDLRFQRHPVEAVDLLQAGRRSDVDLGEPVADHVDADEDQAAPGELGPDDLADLEVARAERVLHRLAADLHVGARRALG